MRRDLYAGLVVSLLANGTLFLSDGRAPAAARPPAKPPVIDVITLPALTPDEPPPVDEEAPAQPREVLAAPSLPDPPALPAPDAMVQAVQPPAPAAPTDPLLNRIPEETRPAPGADRIWDPASLDQRPVATATSAPLYPFKLKQDGVEGSAVVDFVVDALGRVRGAYAASATDPEFARAAVAGVSKWSFKPGRKGGRAVSTHMQIPIVFTLQRGD